MIDHNAKLLIMYTAKVQIAGYERGEGRMNIHCVLHESFEGPGAIKTWAEKRGHHIAYTKLYEKQELPLHLDDVDFLVIMGGPQSPDTTLEECQYFDTKKEIDLIKKAIAHKKSILGVCLGAQLIGLAYGVPHSKSPHREIGIFPLTLTQAGLQDPIFKTFPKTFDVGHWHADMPGVPENARVLASSAGCPRQIIKFDDNVYGFQCHFEFTPKAINGMLKNCASDLKESGLYVYRADDFEGKHYDQMNELLFRFFDHID